MVILIVCSSAKTSLAIAKTGRFRALFWLCYYTRFLKASRRFEFMKNSSRIRVDNRFRVVYRGNSRCRGWRCVGLGN